MCEKPPRPDTGDSIEVTPAMLDAGVEAYYANSGEDWDNPGTSELRQMLSLTFVAMFRSQRES